MTKEEKIAYITSQVTCAMLDGMGMQAENQGRLHAGLALAYNDEAFFNLKITYGIDQNSVLSLIRDI